MDEDDSETADLARPVSGLKSDPRRGAPKVGQQDAHVREAKQAKTAAELARMIEADLAKHPQCPKQGFRVTVYGATPWRAMLTISPAAGPVRNAQEWRDLTEGLAERLRGRFDLAWR